MNAIIVVIIIVVTFLLLLLLLLFLLLLLLPIIIIMKKKKKKKEKKKKGLLSKPAFNDIHWAEHRIVISECAQLLTLCSVRIILLWNAVDVNSA